MKTKKEKTNNYDWEEKKIKINARMIFIVVVILICVVSLNLAVFLTITEKEEKKETELPGEEAEIIDNTELVENFQSIFDNTLDTQNSPITVNKLQADKDIVDIKYKKQDAKDQQYDIAINIPFLNINHKSADEINKDIMTVFYNKVDSILAQTNTAQTIYNVDYKAYINDNILSLIIRSTLKEGDKAQRLIIKTYNYNLSSNEQLDFTKIMEYKGFNEKTVQSKINETIKAAAATASNYQSLGYTTYLRNKDDEMYLVKNTTTFFLGEGKSLYIIYPYGNSNFTSELDLLVI